MPFPRNVRDEALLACKRYCCYCEKYSGLNMEIHHIIQEADGGSNTLDNAIPVCLNCHGTIGAYNSNHPKGTKYSSKELKKIRDDFYAKIKDIPRKVDQKTEADEKLLLEFQHDFTETLEYIVETDFSSELVNINLFDTLASLINKWTKKKYIFKLKQIENTKNDILISCIELQKYLTIEYLRLHETSGHLIFKNDSYEAGEKLREELRPETVRIRTQITHLLEQLYMY